MCGATELARTFPPLGKVIADIYVWRDWAQPHRAHLPRGVFRSLIYTPAITSTGFKDGRHRVAYLRLHHPPEYEILVCEVDTGN